jgi:hypothetical protein
MQYNYRCPSQHESSKRPLSELTDPSFLGTHQEGRDATDLGGHAAATGLPQGPHHGPRQPERSGAAVGVV